jgi:non-canonical poly(A) RNA polymerase PAPD5/7
VRAEVPAFFPSYEVEVFGSERNGVAFATSDIDFRLKRPSQTPDPSIEMLPPTKVERKRRYQTLMQLFNRAFRKNPHYFLPVIRYARYALISAQHRASGLDIQIVLCNDTSLSSAMMKQYMDDIPYLRQLYYVVKNIFDTRGLSDVYRGGFGSYPIFMMIVASIKHAPHERQDAAGALLNFLKFYRDFDTTKHGISIEPVALFDKAKHPVVTGTFEARLKVRRVSMYLLFGLLTIVLLERIGQTPPRIHALPPRSGRQNKRPRP